MHTTEIHEAYEFTEDVLLIAILILGGDILEFGAYELLGWLGAIGTIGTIGRKALKKGKAIVL